MTNDDALIPSGQVVERPDTRYLAPARGDLEPVARAVPTKIDEKPVCSEVSGC